MTAGSTPVATATVEAVAKFFAVQCGIDLHDEGAGRQRAAEFCDRFGGLAEAKLLYAYVCRQRRRDDQDGSGLMIHILGDQRHTKRVLAHMQAKSEKVGRHGAAPAMDLPVGSRESLAQAAGYTDVEKWEAERDHMMMWARWRYERCHLDYDDRLQDIANEFGYTLEDTYDVLSAEVRREFECVITYLESRVEALRGVKLTHVSAAMLKAAEARLREAQSEEADGLQDFHAKELERVKAAKKRAKRKEAEEAKA